MGCTCEKNNCMKRTSDSEKTNTVAGKGINYSKNYVKKMVDDVIKFNIDHGIEQEHAPTFDNLTYYGLCLAGEAGEVANVVKKMWRDGDDAEKRQHLGEEMVDLMIFASLIIQVSGIDFDAAWKAKHEELYERWSKMQIGSRKINLSVQAK